MINKKFSFVIYLLDTVLVLIISIFVFRIITHISHVNVDDEITISQYTGERIFNSYSQKPAKIATYINTTDETYIKGLSSADVIIEFLSKSHGITYKAIFNYDASKLISGPFTLNDYSNSILPKFNFTNNIEPPEVKCRNANRIFVTFSEDSSSNFLYENGVYSHYRGLRLDKDDNTPVVLSNIIVQFVSGNLINEETLTSSEKYGTGLLFSSGVAKDITWSRKKNSPIKIIDSKGSKVSLISGHTWWILIDKSSSVAYD